MLVRLSGVGVQRGGRWLTRNVDLDVRPGEIVTLIGPNGSGKTTTAKVAAGVIQADEGRAEKRRDLRIGYVPQKIQVDWTLPVTVRRLMTLTSRHSASEIAHALEAVGIAHLADAEVQSLSGGEFQRALLARAMVRRPNLLILDEPVQGVDYTGEVTLYGLIKQIRDETGCGILLISHDLHVVMAETDTVVCLNGHVCCRGTRRRWQRTQNTCACLVDARRARWRSTDTSTTTPTCRTAGSATPTARSSKVTPITMTGTITTPPTTIKVMTITAITMLDDFFVRALLAGIGVALTAGPLGCFVVWRRMAYFGDTMAHAGLLGVALSLVLQIAPVFGVFVVAATIAGLLLLLDRRRALSTDALLGLLSHGTLAVGLVMVALMTWVRIDLTALLFGDVLAVGVTDIVLIWAGGAVVLAGLFWFWRPLLADTVHPDLAAAEGMHPERARAVLMLLMALVIAVAMKVIGVLLITSLLIIPAAAARRLAATPEAMAVLAALTGALAVVLGLFASLQWDTPSGPSIVVAAILLFVAGLVLPALRLGR